MKTFRVKGRIVDKESGKGIADLFVTAFDKDHLYDGLLNEAVTDEKGFFEIRCPKRRFGEIILDNRPDFHLRVSTFDGKQVLVTEDAIRYHDGKPAAIDIVISEFERTPLTPIFEVNVQRPQDFLFIRFKFINLKVDDGHLKRHIRRQPAYLIAQFPPQNIAEEAFFEKDDKIPIDSERDSVDAASDSETPHFPCESRLSEPSRLVFKIAKDESIPYSLDGILEAIGKLDLNLAPTAFPPLIYLHPRIKPLQLAKRVELLGHATFNNAGPKVSDAALPAQEWLARSSLKNYLPQEYDDAIRAEIATLFIQARLFFKPRLRPPKETETSIEAPYRLLISPNKYAAWAHAKEPVISPQTKRTELWHTRCALRLQGQLTEADHRLKTIRAIWTRDPFFQLIADGDAYPPEGLHYNPNLPNPVLNPFRMSLDAFDRENIVYLTANHHIENFPTPVDVKRLMMTSYGAWLNLHGAWEPKGGLSVEEWRHRGTMGRDHYVRVVYKGYLFSFGHKASLVKVTERKFHPQVIYIIEYAGMLFVRKVNTFTKSFDASTQTAAKSFIREIAKSYTHNVENLVQAIAEQPPSQIKDAIRESRSAFKEDAEGLLQSSNQKAKTQLRTLADGAAAAFKVNIQDVAKAVGKIAAVDVPGNIAYLRQRMYIVVREPERLYIDAGFDNLNRQMPFARVKVNTLVTPDLDEPSETEIDSKGQSFFKPKVGGKLFQFDMVAEDFAGNEVNFSTPLYFVESTLVNYTNPNGSDNPTAYESFKVSLNKGNTAYENDAQPAFEGKSIMFADSSSDPGKTTFETDHIQFGAAVLNTIGEHKQLQASLADEGFPPFYPKVVQAEVRIPSIKHLAGNAKAAKIAYSDAFLADGFHATNNKGQIFAHLVDPVDLDFNSQGDRSGGLAKPNMAISGLSRLMGPVAGEASDLSNLAKGTLDPQAFFGALDAKIFGVINLWDIIEVLLPDDFLDAGGEKIPKLLPVITKDKMEVGFEYKPPLKDWNNLFIASSKGKKAAFELSAKLTAYTAGGAEINIYCGLKNFSIDLIGPLESFLVIHFNEIAFISSGGKKTEVDVDFDEIEFVGVLAFVEALKDFIPLDGFSDPPALDVNEKGITASFSLSLPSVAVGVFSLENISLGASFVLPFLVDPLSVRFHFCERQSPFLLTVSMFGGGGFFAITVDPAGVQQLEASFEFGASVSVSFGVASGGVYVMAGIYFMMQANPEKAELTGYFRMGGEVDVLGIISVSIELYLSLTYEFTSGKCVGKATLTIEVDVLFFSASVQISCERKFAGSNGDPTFKELMAPYTDPVSAEMVKPWEIYCQAYA